MQVIYSVGSRLGSSGIGRIAYKEVKAVCERGCLKRLIASSIAKGVGIDPGLCRAFGWPGRGTQKLLAMYPSCTPLEMVTDWGYDLFARQHVERCDIFHGWGLHSLFSMRKAKDLGAATTITRASSHILTQNRLLQDEYAAFGVKSSPIPNVVIERSLQEYSEADYISVPSTFVVDSFKEHGYPESKLIVDPFGVDAAAFRPQRNSDGVFRVLFLGQVGLRKGVQYLLQAWKRLALKNAELVLAGNISEDIKPWLRSQGDLPNTSFVGFSRDVNELCGRSDVFVFPSIEEGSALVTYEAMACGLPVVVTYNSGSVARDSIDGFIVPIRDVDALVEKISYLYENEDTRHAMGQAARKRVEAFTWERHGDRLVDEYERILQVRAVGSP